LDKDARKRLHVKMQRRLEQFQRQGLEKLQREAARNEVLKRDAKKEKQKQQKEKPASSKPKEAEKEKPASSKPKEAEKAKPASSKSESEVLHIFEYGEYIPKKTLVNVVVPTHGGNAVQKVFKHSHYGDQKTCEQIAVAFLTTVNNWIQDFKKLKGKAYTQWL